MTDFVALLNSAAELHDGLEISLNSSGGRYIKIWLNDGVLECGNGVDVMYGDDLTIEESAQEIISWLKGEGDCADIQ